MKQIKKNTVYFCKVCKEKKQDGFVLQMFAAGFKLSDIACGHCKAKAITGRARYNREYV